MPLTLINVFLNKSVEEIKKYVNLLFNAPEIKINIACLLIYLCISSPIYVICLTL